MRLLRWGGLPAIFSFKHENEKATFLDAYVYTYFREEIVAEQLVRKVDLFRRFLDAIGQCNGTILNMSKIADDIGADNKKVKVYFEIIEDTLLGFMLPAFSKSIRKQQKSAPKFYLFDCGVKRALDNLTTVAISSSSELGLAFEHFIIAEIIRLNSYKGKRYRIYYLATKGGLEIDLIVERPGRSTVCVEIKSTDSVTKRHIEHLLNVKKDYPEFEALYFSREKIKRELSGVAIYPWV
jgi:uncharacterized protein